jgi:hypothetical protein
MLRARVPESLLAKPSEFWPDCHENVSKLKEPMSLSSEHGIKYYEAITSARSSWFEGKVLQNPLKDRLSNGSFSIVRTVLSTRLMFAICATQSARRVSLG